MAGSKSYYPPATLPTEFDGLFGRQMQGVAAIRTDIRDAIEKRQPYQPGFAWLGHLAELTNENKHRRLTPQARTETMEIKPGPGGGTIGTPGGAQIQLGEGASIQLGGRASIGFGGPVFTQNIQQSVYVDWLLADLGVSALGTVKAIQVGLRKLVSDVCKVAGL